MHIRTTNPIESTFATVRHRTKKSKNCFSRKTIVASVFKLCLEAGASFVFVEAAELFGEELNIQLIRKIGKDIDYNQVIFELPGPWISDIHLCDVHRMTVWLVDNLGPDVNIANVDHHNLLELETLRRGIGTNAGVSH